MRSRVDVLGGILNGIDTDVWNPSSDPALARGYNARSLGRKAESRARIAERLGLDPDATGLLFCVISRLTEQKGLDALAGAVPAYRRARRATGCAGFRRRSDSNRHSGMPVSAFPGLSVPYRL